MLVVYSGKYGFGARIKCPVICHRQIFKWGLHEDSHNCVTYGVLGIALGITNTLSLGTKGTWYFNVMFPLVKHKDILRYF